MSFSPDWETAGMEPKELEMGMYWSRDRWQEGQRLTKSDPPRLSYSVDLNRNSLITPRF